MSTLTFKGTVSFDITAIINGEVVQEAINELVTAKTHEGFKQLPFKNQVFTDLILEAYKKEGLHGAARELYRYNLREGLNENLKEELLMTNNEITTRLSPVKVVIHDTTTKA